MIHHLLSSLLKTSKHAGNSPFLIPIGSMYGIFTYIYHKNHPNVGKYTIHGSYGIGKAHENSQLQGDSPRDRR